MYLLHIAIILQLTGAIDTVAGFVFMLLSPQERLLTGMVLSLIGSTTFLLGRLVLRASRKVRPVPIGHYRELYQPQQQTTDYYASPASIPGGRFRS